MSTSNTLLAPAVTTILLVALTSTRRLKWHFRCDEPCGPSRNVIRLCRICAVVDLLGESPLRCALGGTRARGAWRGAPRRRGAPGRAAHFGACRTVAAARPAAAGATAQCARTAGAARLRTPKISESRAPLDVGCPTCARSRRARRRQRHPCAAAPSIYAYIWQGGISRVAAAPPAAGAAACA